MRETSEMPAHLAAPSVPREETRELLSRDLLGEISRTLGRYLVALPFLIYPYFHFKYGSGVATIVPPWIPWRLLWAYFCGATMLAAGLAIVFRKYSRLAAVLLGIEVLLFVALIHFFLIFYKPGDPWADGGLFKGLDLPGRLNNAFKDFGLSGAIFIVAASEGRVWARQGKDLVLTVGRMILASSTAAFVVLHFVYLAFAPGIPPMHAEISFILPGHAFWVYFSSVIFLIAAVSLFASYRVRLASAVLGCTILFCAFLTWVPRFPSHPGEITDNWLKDIGNAGGALVLAGIAGAPRKQR